MSTSATPRRLGSFILPFLLMGPACGDDTTGAAGGGGAGGGGGATQGTQAGPTGPTATTGAATTTSTMSSSGSGGDTASSGGSGPGAGGEGGGGEGGGGEGGGGEGGGGEGGGGDGGGGGRPIACEGEPSGARLAASSAYADAACTYYGACNRGVFAFLGNEHAVCVALVTLEIDRFANVDDAALAGCLEDLAELFDGHSCSGPSSPEPPATCTGIGYLPDGWPCEDNLECASGVCATGPGCGTCMPVGLEEGDPCEEDAQCLPLSCNGFECAPLQNEGADCDSGADCVGGACFFGTGCGAISYVGEGEPCGFDAYCDGGEEELACDDNSGECVANPPPTPGTQGGACVPWSVDFGGGFFLTVSTCEEGTLCVDAVCTPHALPNEACADGDHCVESTCDAGICEPDADPNACACSGL